MLVSSLQVSHNFSLFLMVMPRQPKLAFTNLTGIGMRGIEGVGISAAIPKKTILCTISSQEAVRTKSGMWPTGISCDSHRHITVDKEFLCLGFH